MVDHEDSTWMRRGRMTTLDAAETISTHDDVAKPPRNRSGSLMGNRLILMVGEGFKRYGAFLSRKMVIAYCLDKGLKSPTPTTKPILEST